MKEILDEVERWRENGEKVVVATVVATRRSAPRPVGTSLAVSESGQMCGSVSGGCVESDVYENAREVMETGDAEAAQLRDRRRGGLGGRPAVRRRDRRLRRAARGVKVEERELDQLRRLVNGYQVTQAIHVAVTLGIADLLADGPARER